MGKHEDTNEMQNAFWDECVQQCEPNNDESYVRCQKCGAEGPLGDFNQAGERWNNRIISREKGGHYQNLNRDHEAAMGVMKETFVPSPENTQHVVLDADFPSGVFEEVTITHPSLDKPIVHTSRKPKKIPHVTPDPINNELPVLTRDQAVKRIRDIRNGIGIDHHKPNGIEPFWSMHTQGAIYELMAIFDIKEEEL